ncbi:methyl-accepting chemotaxis protein [Pseudoalteromonas sp. SWN29]|uniref:methyl-accepting chemotaxis protein n=1 Tax=Pseudoalteromonas sp. SWN29 TaxID=2792064 RepID=UPI0018CDB70D|nr:methyl-accepting chemotaxis protein [Pseudoalteromonas sp. SWN29]MBH0027914.1 methyl-accepting chemotaxis protein [Pseudoalteromonas sp. SWN29]
MLRKISIRLRSALAFSFIGLLVIIVGLFSIFRLNLLNTEINTIAETNVPALETSLIILSDFYNLRLQNSNVINATEANQLSYKQIFDNTKRTLLDNIKKMAPLLNTKNEKHQLEVIESDIYKFLSLQNQQIKLLAENNLQGVQSLQENEMKQVRDGVTQAISNIVESQQANIRDGKIKAQYVFDQSIFFAWITLIVAIILVWFFAWSFTRSIIKPMRNVLDLAQSIARGDLTQPISDEGNDETTSMIIALSQMQQTLRNTINKIQDSSHNLVSTSEELSVVTEQSTQGIISQNEQLEQAISAVTELTVSAEHVAQSSADTSRESDSANEQALAGLKQVEDTVTTITALLSEIDKTQDGIKNLATEVNKIGSVLDVIRDVTDQTNLLAVNAAIEAARAGSYGRGFAVVADGVRALAHRTSESTKEIELMIQSVQSGTKNTVISVQSSHDKAQKSLDISQLAGKALIEITTAVAHINSQNATIASSAHEQANVSREIDKNLLVIRDVAAEVASGATQTNMSSHELSRLADSLDDLIKQFKV